MRLILVCGKARHGKDSFAHYVKELLQELGYSVQLLRFADGVKNTARKVGWNGKKDHNGRVLLQFIGTEWGRQMLGEDFWVEQAECRFDEEADFIIIPDARFKNEIEYFREDYNIVPVRIVRLNEDGTLYKELEGKQGQHPSEIALDDYSCITIQAVHLKDLFKKAEDFIDLILFDESIHYYTKFDLEKTTYNHLKECQHDS